MSLQNLVLNSMYTVPPYEWDAFKHDANFMDLVKKRMSQMIAEKALHSDMFRVKVQDAFVPFSQSNNGFPTEMPGREIRMQAAIIPVESFQEIINLSRNPRYSELRAILERLEADIKKVQFEE